MQFFLYWMLYWNKLSLNIKPRKTELLVFGTNQQLTKILKQTETWNFPGFALSGSILDK